MPYLIICNNAVQKASILFQRVGCAKGERGQGKGFPKGKALSRKGKRKQAAPIERGRERVT